MNDSFSVSDFLASQLLSPHRTLVTHLAARSPPRRQASRVMSGLPGFQPPGTPSHRFPGATGEQRARQHSCGGVVWSPRNPLSFCNPRGGVRFWPVGKVKSSGGFDRGFGLRRLSDENWPKPIHENTKTSVTWFRMLRPLRTQ